VSSAAADNPSSIDVDVSATNNVSENAKDAHNSETESMENHVTKEADKVVTRVDDLDADLNKAIDGLEN